MIFQGFADRHVHWPDRPLGGRPKTSRKNNKTMERNRHARAQGLRPGGMRQADRRNREAFGRGSAGTGYREQPVFQADLVRRDNLFIEPAVKDHLNALLYRAIDAVCPLKGNHRRDLPDNIVTLSRMLTVNRAELQRPYWVSAPLTSAYVHYFLPWNIFRLTRLFSGLKLPAPPAEGEYFMLDLGSGPLTLPLALWLASPEWRARRLTLMAVDCAGHPLHIGKTLLETMARMEGCEPWKVHLVQAPLIQGLRRAGALVQKGLSPWLVSAANVLNELPPARRRHGDEEDGAAGERSRHEEVLKGVTALLRKGQPDARALFVEPGTRLGGLTLMYLRALACETKLSVYGPCPHEGLCPLYRDEYGDDCNQDEYGSEYGEDEADALLDSLEELDETAEVSGAVAAVRQGRVSRLAGRSWCHATFGSEGVSRRLADLSARTGFAKESLSLSWLLLGANSGDQPAQGTCTGTNLQEEEHAQNAQDAAREGMELLRLRLISQPFRVPGSRGLCRYACSSHGLILLDNAADLANGALLTLRLEKDALARARVDERSGALCLSLRRAGEQGHAGAGRGRRPRTEAGSDALPDRYGTARQGRQGRQDRRPGRRPDSNTRREAGRPAGRGQTPGPGAGRKADRAR